MGQWLNFWIVYYHLGLAQSLYMTLKAGNLGRLIHMYLVGYCFGGFGALYPDPCGHWSFSGPQFPGLVRAVNLLSSS